MKLLVLVLPCAFRTGPCAAFSVHLFHGIFFFMTVLCRVGVVLLFFTGDVLESMRLLVETVMGGMGNRCGAANNVTYYLPVYPADRTGR